MLIAVFTFVDLTKVCDLKDLRRDNAEPCGDVFFGKRHELTAADRTFSLIFGERMHDLFRFKITTQFISSPMLSGFL